MAARSLLFFFLPLLLAVLVAVPHADAKRQQGSLSYDPIPDPEDGAIQALAKFAVRRHSRESGERFTLTRVLGGQQQVGKAINYRLVIGVTGNSGAEELYLAVLRVWNSVRELKDFQLIA